jgi:predicted CoA-binding protein
VNEPDKIQKALETAETVAVIGCSPNPARPSNSISRYLLEQGYSVIPVNPGHREILKQKCYRSLSEIPLEVRVDLVDVFRRPEAVPALAEEAIARGVPFVFLQLGVVHREAAGRLEAAGVGVAMDRCILVEHRRLGLAPRDARNFAPRV